tara:strand:- start:470 stop:598 length:129 start_codon:yes stop_codon:yes gene_type:complete
MGKDGEVLVKENLKSIESSAAKTVEFKFLNKFVRLVWTQIKR